MARTFTAGRTGPDVLATEPTLLEVLNALQNIEVDIEAQANPAIVTETSGTASITLAPAANGYFTAGYVVPVGKKLLIKGISVIGNGDGYYYLEINGGVTYPWSWRSSWSEKGQTVPFEYQLAAGDSVSLGVENVSTHGNTNQYDGTFWGYLSDA